MGLSINWLSGLIPLIQTTEDDAWTKHVGWRKANESEISLEGMVGVESREESVLEITCQKENGVDIVVCIKNTWVHVHIHVL